MTLSLPPAQGFAIYTSTASGNAAVVRLPKNDDIYYYYNKSGEKQYNIYEQNLRALRDEAAGGNGKAGKLAYHPDSVGEPKYTLTNEAASTSFVFGNPAMAYIDIWGFIADNGLAEEIGYIAADGKFYSVTKSAAELTENVITNLERYLPPMQAIVVKVAAEATSKVVKLNPNRIITAPSQIVRSGAPRRATASARSKGIMTVTAINPIWSQCSSRLLLGQGFHNDIVEGEDAMLTTINIDNFSATTPTTPFNIYAAEGNSGLSIDLRDSLVNVPLSFYMTQLPVQYEPVTYLWFTGVNAIDGSLVLYDALMGTERPIIDGICLNIETPEGNHEKRYYIRRRGYTPEGDSGAVATELDSTTGEQQTTAIKIIRNGHVYIIRDGHVYTMFGQKIR